jgi:hypothetical protein
VRAQPIKYRVTHAHDAPNRGLLPGVQRSTVAEENEISVDHLAAHCSAARQEIPADLPRTSLYCGQPGSRKCRNGTDLILRRADSSDFGRHWTTGLGSTAALFAKPVIGSSSRYSPPPPDPLPPLTVGLPAPVQCRLMRRPPMSTGLTRLDLGQQPLVLRRDGDRAERGQRHQCKAAWRPHGCSLLSQV